jgi:hypothetical protein
MIASPAYGVVLLCESPWNNSAGTPFADAISNFDAVSLLLPMGSLMLATAQPAFGGLPPGDRCSDRSLRDRQAPEWIATRNLTGRLLKSEMDLPRWWWPGMLPL